MDRTDKINIDNIVIETIDIKMDRNSWGTTRIEALEEILGSLRITEDYISDRNRTMRPVLEEMS